MNVNENLIRMTGASMLAVQEIFQQRTPTLQELIAQVHQEGETPDYARLAETFDATEPFEHRPVERLVDVRQLQVDPVREALPIIASWNIAARVESE